MQYKKIVLATILTFPLFANDLKAVDNFYNMQLGDSGISLSPGAEISVKHNDNIFLQDSGPGKISSWVTEINPYLSFNTHRESGAYNFRYSLKSGFYHSSHNDDYLDHIFEINYQNEASKRNRFVIHASYNLLHEARGTGISDSNSITFDKPDKYTDTIISGTYTYGVEDAKMNLEFEAGFLDKEYTNHESVTQFYDFSEPKVGATFYYRIMPKTKLLIQAKYKDISYDRAVANTDKLDSNEQNYQLGVTWDATAKTTGIAKAGYLYKDFDSSNYNDQGFASWELGVNWSPRDSMQFNLLSSSSATESKGTGSFTEVQSYIASWIQQWNSRVATTLELSRLDSDFIDSLRDDTVDSVKLHADYEFTPEIKFGVSYNHSNRESTLINSDYKNNIFMVQGTIGL